MTVNLEEERLKILTDAYDHRKREVMHHQINIDNYQLALAEIAAFVKGRLAACRTWRKRCRRLARLWPTNVVEFQPARPPIGRLAPASAQTWHRARPLQNPARPCPQRRQHSASP